MIKTKNGKATTSTATISTKRSERKNAHFQRLTKAKNKNKEV